MFDPAINDALRESRRLDLDDALDRYAESYTCDCGGDYEAEDLGDYTILLTCKDCGDTIKRYEGRDYA